MTSDGLNDCLTDKELKGLLDSAFAAWQRDSRDPFRRRRTPRITAEHARSLFVSSYRHDGDETELNRAAKLVDVSADGLGLVLDVCPPLQATIRFAFRGEDGECGFGTGRIVRTVGHANGYLVGVEFAEEAASIDINPDDDTASSVRWPFYRRAYYMLRHALRVTHGVLSRCSRARRAADQTVDGIAARLEVTARLFRYTATLFVAGNKVAHRTGPLSDRVGNLLLDNPIPTIINLDGGGFIAWATLRSNEVTSATIVPDASLTERICARLSRTGPTHLART